MDAKIDPRYVADVAQFSDIFFDNGIPFLMRSAYRVYDGMYLVYNVHDIISNFGVSKKYMVDVNYRTITECPIWYTSMINEKYDLIKVA